MATFSGTPGGLATTGYFLATLQVASSVNVPPEAPNSCGWFVGVGGRPIHGYE
jgi:hypothetical protein